MASVPNHRCLGARWKAGCLLVAMLLCPVSRLSAERAVTLAWNHSAGTSVAGYYVYAWEDGADTPMRVDAGLNNFAVVGGLKEGLRYVFEVTAYNILRLESQPTEGLPYDVPVPLELLSRAGETGVLKLRFPAAPGRWYQLQASTDLVNWSTIWQTGVANSYSWTEYQDPRAQDYPVRFYRLQVY